MTLSGDQLWIGGRRDSTNRQTWVWSDGTPWGYDNWASDEPNDFGGNSDCSRIMSNGEGWGDKECTPTLQFVCKKDKHLSPSHITPTATPAQPECQADWREYNGKCYKFFSEEKKWNDAKTDCVTEKV